MAESHWCYKVGFRLSIVVVTGPKSPIFWRSPSWWYCTLCQNLKIYYLVQRNFSNVYQFYCLFFYNFKIEFRVIANSTLSFFFIFHWSSLTKYLNTFDAQSYVDSFKFFMLLFFIFTIIIFFQVDDFFWKKSSHNTWNIK